ncbi:hypothetical protein GCM10023238_00900 [Streptomyces heliomycini]
MALALLEAMACGRPVVVTDVDGARESLPPSFAAVRGAAEDPRPWRERVGDCCSTGAARVPRRPGRRHVLSLHDVRHTARAVADIYHDLLGTRPVADEDTPLSGGRGRRGRPDDIARRVL